MNVSVWLKQEKKNNEQEEKSLGQGELIAADFVVFLYCLKRAATIVRAWACREREREKKRQNDLRSMTRIRPNSRFSFLLPSTTTRRRWRNIFHFFFFEIWIANVSRQFAKHRLLLSIIYELTAYKPVGKRALSDFISDNSKSLFLFYITYYSFVSVYRPICKSSGSKR